MKTRFAPSPTGLLHLGHVYAAKYAFDLARENDGSFLLRFEDIDTTRVREEYYGMIEEDLHWLGMTWEVPVIRQTERMGLYRDALNELKSQGVVYPCFCTRREIQEEIAAMSNAPHGPEGALYPGICKSLSASERDDRLARGGRSEAHCWRLDAERAANLLGKVTFEDALHGNIEMDLSLLGDVVLARKDITTSYHLAVVVDDAAQEITDVTRGEDLLASTHVHRALQSLLGLPVPRYHHHRLVCDEDGKRLAKRNEALSVRHLREEGRSPDDVLKMIDLHLLYTQD